MAGADRRLPTGTELLSDEQTIELFSELTVAPDPIYWRGYREGKAAVQAQADEALRLLAYLWREAGIEQALAAPGGGKVRDLFREHDPLSEEIEKVLDHPDRKASGERPGTAK